MVGDHTRHYVLSSLYEKGSGMDLLQEYPSVDPSKDILRPPTNSTEPRSP